MTGPCVTDLILSVIIAACMSTAYLWDGPTHPQPHTSAAQAAKAEHDEALRQARFERAARKVCGAGSGAFEVLADGVIQCLVQGRTVVTAKVAL